MKKASEYREHAAECRKLAASMEGEQRDQLLKMAVTWDQLATERERATSRTAPSPEAPKGSAARGKTDAS